MAAAAARAALVAMQKKKRKKENMLKKLSSNINFDEDDRLFLLESLFDKDSTKFLADLAGGDELAPVQEEKSNKYVNKRESGLQKPYFISDRHFRYLLNRMSKGVKKEDILLWTKAYFKANFSCQCGEITGKVSPETPMQDSWEASKFPTSQPKAKTSDFIFRYNEFICLNQVVVESQWFNGLIVFSILVAGVLVGLQSYPAMSSLVVLDIADILIQIIFSFECLFKILAEGRKPLRYWFGPDRRWNNFDFWIVFFCWIPMGVDVSILRLLRLLRLLKLVDKVKQLHVIVMGLFKGIAGVSYIFLLMMLIFYLFAVMGVALFRQNDPYHFGSLGVSMLSLFRAATLEDWADIMYINWFGCDSGYSGVLGVYESEEDHGNVSSQGAKKLKMEHTQAGDFPGLICDKPMAQPVLSAIFFISFVLVAAFVIMALFVGAVCGGMYEALDDFKIQEEEELEMMEKEQAEEEDASEFYKLQTFRDTFDVLDKDCSGLIDAQELTYVMKLIGVQVSVQLAEEMIREADVDNKGGLDFRAFVHVMTDGKGTDQALKPRRRMSLEEHEQHHKSMKLSMYIRRAWRGEVNKKFEILDHDPWIRKLYFSLAIKADHIVSDERFINMITLTILAAGVVVGIQTEMDATTPLLNILDAIILAIFTIEVVLKVMAEGDEPQRYFYDNWNCFDFFIVFACFIFILPFMPDVGSMLAMLRLLRLLRVLKLVKALPQLRVIIEALSTVGSIAFIVLLLFLLFYLFANIAIIFFGENDPMHFGNLQVAFVSLFVITTLDDWTDIMYTNMLGCDVYGYDFGSADLGFDEKSKDSILNCTKPTAFGWYAAMLIVVFVVMSSFVLLNVFIGLVAIAMEESKMKQKNEAQVAEKLAVRMQQLDVSKKEVKLYQQVFDELDQKKDGQLDTHDFKALIRCLPMLRFATALMEDGPDIGRASNKFDTFKVMNKKDIKYLMLLINPEYSGIIEMPDFLVLMDFMRRVDKSPLILHSFRESVENAIEDHDKTVEILPTIFDNEPMTDGQLSRSSNGSMDPASFAEPDSPPPMVRRRSQFIKIDEYHRVTSKMQSEINDKDVINDGIKQELNRLKSELEKAKKHMKKLEEVHGIVKAVPSPGSSVRRIFQDVKSSSVESNQPTWVAKKTAPQQRSSLEARFRRFSQDYSDDNFVGVSGSSGTGEYTSGGVTIDNDRVDTIESMCDDSDASSSTSTAGDRQTTPNPIPTSSQISNRLSVGSGYKTAQVSDTTSSMDESQRLRSASRSGSDTAAISRLDEPDSASSNTSTLPPLDMSEGGSSVGEPSPYRTTPSLRANHTQSLSEYDSMDPPTDTL